MIFNLRSHWRSFFFFFMSSTFFFKIVIQLQLSAFSSHPSTPPPPNPPPSPTSTLPLDFVHVYFIVVPINPSPHCPLTSPLWPLPDCSQLQCLWLYSACSFLLLIMFQLKARSCGICPSLPTGGLMGILIAVYLLSTWYC